ncbi:MAG: Kelch repeat-containing protein [Gammaproteobacteria bacterium]
MRKVMAIAVLLLLIGGAAYLYYVRGVGVSAQIPRPATIERAGGLRTYTWAVSTAMPTPRTEVAAAVLAGKIYVIGGFDGLGRTVATVEVYDPASGLWAAGPDLLAPRHHIVAVTAGDALYALGGYTGSSFEPHAEVYALDARTTSWRPVAPLLAARGAMAAAALDGKLYLVGGVGPEGLANELYVYDTVADHWEERRPAPTRRDHLAAAALHGRLYLGGGREQSLSKNLATLEVYDPTADTWNVGTNMPTARGGVAGAAFDGLFVIVGGERPGATHAEVEAFDPKSGRWLSLPPLPTARHGLAATVVGNVLYVIGGGTHPGLSVSGRVEALEVH